MAKQGFGLVIEDIRILREVIRWWRGRGGSRRPVPTRRRTRGGGGRSSIFGILIADLPGCTVEYLAASPWSSSTPGTVAEAVIPLSSGNGTFNARLNAAEDDQVKLYAVNPAWPFITKAGTTFGADKPVMVLGYEVTLDVSGTPTPAFIVEQVIYPLTIIKGLTTAAVTGSAFTIDGVSVLWGRDPREDTGDAAETVSVANDFAWDADDNATCYAMEIVGGTFVAIQLACPA